MKNFLKTISIFTMALLIASCGGGSTDEHDEHGEEEGHHEEHENANTATLTAEQMLSIGLELGSIEKKQLTSSLKANGILKVPNQNRASITSPLGGIIQSILIQPGTTVKKGQAIATITDPGFIKLQEDFLSTSAKADLALKEYNRQKELNQGNVGSGKTLEQSETDMNVLNAQRASLQKQLELTGVNTKTLTSDNISSVLTVRSPINGSVSHVEVNIGSSVEPGTVIAEVVDNSQLHVDLFVYEKDLSKLQVGQTIHFTLTNNAGKEYDAKIYGIGNTFEENTQSIAVHAEVEGDKTGLIDGMSITALVSLEDATVDAVPTDAIANFQGQDFIFIVTDAHSEEEHHDGDSTNAGEAEHRHDEHGHDHAEGEEHAEDTTGALTFEKIPVRKGTTDVGYSEITLLQEIPANSRIVTKGAFFVLAKMTNQGEGHSH